MINSRSRRVINRVAAVMLLGAVTACTSESDSTGGSIVDNVTGGTVVVDDVATPVSDVEAAAETTTAPSDSSPDTTATPPPPAPASTPPPSGAAETPAATDATSPGNDDGGGNSDGDGDGDGDDDDDVIGDGPVLTVRAGDVDDTGSGGLLPVFFALEAAATGCASGTGSATLRWEVIGTESVDLAIDSTEQVLQTNQPPAGTSDMPFDCETGNKYYVIARNAEGTAVRAISVEPA